MPTDLPILDFILTNYKNFNARATRDAVVAYWRHVARGGRMFWALAGAMSSAQLGITLAPAIRAGLIHGLSDSTTSYGSYSGATPNEKITWDKLTAETPMFVIESDATIVAPLVLRALLECKANPGAAEARIAAAGL